MALGAGSSSISNEGLGHPPSHNYFPAKRWSAPSPPPAVVVSVALGAGGSNGGGSGNEGLGDFGDSSVTVLPIDYVLALMALFFLMVAERTV